MFWLVFFKWIQIVAANRHLSHHEHFDTPLLALKVMWLVAGWTANLWVPDWHPAAGQDALGLMLDSCFMNPVP